MTATQANLTTCPACRATDSIDLAGGLRLCLQCRNEWNPRDVQAAPIPPAAPMPPLPGGDQDVARVMASTTADEVLAEPLTAADYLHDHGIATADDVQPDDYLGCWCVDDGTDEVWLCIGSYSSGTVDLQAQNGKVRVGVSPEAVTWIADDDLHEWGITNEPADDDGPMVGVIATIAALVLTTGVASIGDDEDRTLLNPPTGWLPPPASDIPEAEQGAAYAVAILVRTFNLDTENVLAIAQSLMAGASASTTETEH